MENLFKKFVEFRTKNKNMIKDSSFKIYKRNLKKIVEILKGKSYIFKDMDIFKDYEVVFEKIKDFSIDKQKKIINAIMVFLMEEEKYKELKTKYYNYKSNIEKKITQRRKEQFKTEKEDENWLNFKELNHIVNNRKRDFNLLDRKVKKKVKEGKKVRFKFNNEKSESYILSKENEKTILNYLITQLYCGDPFIHGPRRSVYSSFRIVSSDVYNSIENRDKGNYLIVENKSKKRFQFAEYKTSGYSEEPFVIDLSKKMNKAINDVIPYLLLYYKKYYDEKWYRKSFNIPLIRNINTREQAKSNHMTSMIQNIFKCTNCNVSINSLRKIIITEFYKRPRTKKEKEIFAKSCGHNITTAEYTYNKAESN